MNGEFPDFTHRLVMPDYGLPLIGTLLAKEGYDVRLFIEHVQPPSWEAIRQSDLVCFSTLNAGADKVYKLAGRIRAELGIPTVLGGTHASYYRRPRWSTATTSSSERRRDDRRARRDAERKGRPCRRARHRLSRREAYAPNADPAGAGALRHGPRLQPDPGVQADDDA